MKCSNCGTQLPDDAKFCASCGNRVETPAPEVIPAYNAEPITEEVADNEVVETLAEMAAPPELIAQPEPVAPPVPAPQPEPVIEKKPVWPTAASQPCRQCGNPLKSGAQFCNKCGAKVAATPLPAAQDSYCPRCANKVKPGVAFCATCGTRLAAAATFTPPVQRQYQQPYPQAPVYQQPAPVPVQQPYGQYYNPYQQPPARPKRKKGWLVALIVILVIALAGGGTYMLFGKQLRRSLMGPKATYLEIEGIALRENAADLIETIVKYGNKDANEKGGFNMSLQLALDATALELDPQISTIFERLRIKNSLMYDRSGDSPLVYDKLELLSVTEHLVDIELLYGDEQLVIRVPEIFDEYLVAATADLADTFGSGDISIGDIDLSEFSSYAGLLTGTGALDLGVNEQKLNQTIGKIINILLAHIDTCELKTGQTLTVGTVSATYDLYEMSISKDSARAMITEILELLQDDEEFYNLYKRIAGTINGESDSGEITFEQYQADIQEAIDDIADESNDDGDFTIHQLLYVNSQDEVVGRELTVIDDTDTTQLHIQYAQPVDGRQEAYLLSLDTETESFGILADYIVSGDKKTGQATISSMGSDLLTIDFTDFVHIETDESDKIRGNFICTIVDPASISEDMPAQFTLDISESGGETVFKVAVPEMLDLQLNYAAIADRDVQIPSFTDGATRVDISDSTAMEVVMDSEAQDKIMAIMEKLGIDTSDME
jgi:hypothetical protein